MHFADTQIYCNLTFDLQSSTLTVDDLEFGLSVVIQNKGFARLCKQRDVYLVLKDTTTHAITTSLIHTDIRTWEDSISITQNFDLGVSGTFKLYLWIPDSDTALHANADYSIQFANAGTWDAQTGYNDLSQILTLDSPLSIEDIESEDPTLSIYPNPAANYLTIEVHKPIKGNLQIYNAVGQLVMELNPATKQSIDISHLEEGIYLIKLANNTSAQFKLIKK